MKKVLINIIFTIYAVIAILITICLLSYNKYKVSTFGNTSLVIIDNDSLKSDFNENDLVFIKKGLATDYNIGERIMFYKLNNNNSVTITVAGIINKDVINDDQVTYTLEGDKIISSDYIIGSTENAKSIANIGGVLRVLESKWGFLFLIVLPALVAFLYEIYAIFGEIKNGRKQSKKVNSK